MKERPIIFSAPMVRAILEGRKTVTRRVVKPPRGHEMPCDPLDANDIAGLLSVCPYGQPGDRLWVRETWQHNPFLDAEDTGEKVIYRAEWNEGRIHPASWRPSIHMPRWASRITLEVTGVRVERLQDISEADAIAEGAEPFRLPVHPDREELRHVDGFRKLWESINGAGSWGDNPFVWVVEFKRVGA